MNVKWMFVPFTCTGSLLLSAICAQTCTYGGSTDRCGVDGNGAAYGGFSSPCSCQLGLCCSNSGYCGPEPGVSGTAPASSYCDPSTCQPAFGICKQPPGPYYFEYIGVGDTYKAYGQQATATTNPDPLPGAAVQIPLPQTANFSFIVFVLTDTACQNGKPVLGQNTGTFYPKGQYAAGNSCNQAVLDASQIEALNRSSNVKVMASIAGDSTATVWTSSQVDVSTYVTDAVLSLTQIYRDYSLAGFDIDYEQGISVTTIVNGVEQTNAVSDWLSAWCSIIAQLKQTLEGIIITFSPFGATEAAYQQLQYCLSSAQNTNIDLIIYQTYSASPSPPTDVASFTTLMTRVQALYKFTQVIAGLHNCQYTSNPQQCTSAPIPQLVSQAIPELLASGTIVGASVFDADQSLTPQFGPFSLENGLWGSSTG